MRRARWKIFQEPQGHSGPWTNWYQYTAVCYHHTALYSCTVRTRDRYMQQRIQPNVSESRVMLLVAVTVLQQVCAGVVQNSSSFGLVTTYTHTHLPGTEEHTQKQFTILGHYRYYRYYRYLDGGRLTRLPGARVKTHLPTFSSPDRH